MTAPARPRRERLLRIGTFSRQARLSPHQLRHYLRAPGGDEEVDARPSDAVNLALRSRVPILVAGRVMDESARMPDPEKGPHPPVVVAMAVEAGTGQDMGLVQLRELPGPGDQVPVQMPTGWRVVSVEPAEGDRLPRIVVRRPSAE